MASIPLPAEIITAIIDYLAVDDNGKPASLANFAAVSREWQAQVERRTFSKLKLTPDRLQTALTSTTLFDTTPGITRGAVGCRRFAAVRKVNIEVVLPPYDVEARTRVKSDTERAANKAVFTQTVRRASQLLARGHAAQAFGEDADVKLKLTAHCPSDSVGDEYRQRQLQQRLGFVDDLLEWRYASSYLELVEDVADTPAPEAAREGNGDSCPNLCLPLLPMVTSFQCDMEPRHTHHHPRKFSPAACAIIASRLSRLRAVDWAFCDNEKRDLAGRRARRAAFAHAIPSLPPSIVKVDLTLQYNVLDHSFEHPIALLEASDGRDESTSDPLSAALGRWARRTRCFDLTASIINTFWKALAADTNDNAPDSDDPPGHPFTSILRVSYTEVSPTGQWLIIRPPCEDGREYSPESLYYDDDEIPYLGPADALPEDVRPGVDRFHPNPPLWNRILRESGRAVACLPALRLLLASTGVGSDGVCKVVYNPGDRMVYDTVDRAVLFASYPFEPNGYYQARHSIMSPSLPEPVPNLFGPDEDVVKIWREATKTQMKGVEAEIKLVNMAVLEDKSWA